MVKCKHKNCRKSFISQKSLIYHIKNNHKITIEEYYENFEGMTSEKCLYCENKTSWNKRKYIYNKTCSKKSCIGKNAILISQQIFKEKYGVDNPSQLESFNTKVRATKLKKYGNETYNNSKKAAETSMKKYGVNNPSKSKEVKEKIVESMKKVNKKLQQEKIRKTNMERYGVEHATQSKEIQDKIKKNNLYKYGVDHPMKNKIFYNDYRNNLSIKFGVKNVSQLEHVREKIKGKKFENRKKRLHEKFGEKIQGFPDSYTVEIECDDCNKTSKLNIGFLEQRHKFDTNLCIHCTPYNIPSYIQIEINKWINDLGIETILNYRMESGLEIDIFIPGLNIGIEYNGIYWHSEIYKDKNYHVNKKLEGLEKNINIIHIWEDDYLIDKERIKSRLKNLFGISKKLYARKCKIEVIKSKESKEFLDKYHLHNNINSSVGLGLFHEDELVSVMTLGKRNRLKQNEFEIFRFASKFDYHIIGGFSKLLSFFKKNYNPLKILTFIDLDWANGENNVYAKNGFEFIRITPPDYYWVVNKKRINRNNFMKHKLVKEGYDINKTENDIMHDRGFYKIHGSGNLRYEWK